MNEANLWCILFRGSDYIKDSIPGWIHVLSTLLRTGGNAEDGIFLELAETMVDRAWLEVYQWGARL